MLFFIDFQKYWPGEFNNQELLQLVIISFILMTYTLWFKDDIEERN